ncbi:MAG: glycerophosphodiester phosphodiesterase, partial [Candidatus Acidiferrales bacterium]
YHTVETAQVREVQRAGFWFVVWTVNREGALRRMVELGVDAIATDYPERLVRLRKTSGAKAQFSTAG